MITKTTVRSELIDLYSTLTERFPDSKQFQSDLELFQSGEKRKRPYPVSWFALNVMVSLEFEVESIETKQRLNRYDYTTSINSKYLIEIKTLRLTRRQYERFKYVLRNCRAVRSPDGKIYVTRYTLWFDSGDEMYDCITSSTNEISFAKNLLKVF